MNKNDKPIQLKLGVHDSEEFEQLKQDNKLLKDENEHLREENRRLILKIEKMEKRKKTVILNSSVQTPKSDSQNIYQELVEDSAKVPQANPDEIDKRPSPSQVTRKSPIEEKVALFRSYFKGRDDVYAVRAKDTQGKAPYYTSRVYLGKENGKHRWGDNLPLTDEVIKRHIDDDARPLTVGMYPMLLDETCWFLAIDFDKTR